jgi:N,N'-diacetyllegionaminate synthase
MSSRSTSGCMVVGEVAQAHDGSLGTAHAYIDAVARAGAGAVKFQVHVALEESTAAEPWRVRFGWQDRTRYAYWKRMEFTEEQWHGLREHADQRGLGFIVSPFSTKAVEMMSRVGVSCWKIASGEFNNEPLLRAVAETGLPIQLSTGMSHLREIDAAVEHLRSRVLDLTVLQCTSSYPCPPEKVGLNIIPTLRERYACKVGLSDHTGTIYAGLAAVTLGIDVLEVHVTFSRQCFGPDVPASVTIAELAILVEGVRFIERMLDSPVEKESMAVEMAPLRQVFSRSIALSRDLPAGAVLEPAHLALKKPGTGIPPDRIPKLIGRRLTRSVSANELLREEDLAHQD